MLYLCTYLRFTEMKSKFMAELLKLIEDHGFDEDAYTWRISSSYDKHWRITFTVLHKESGEDASVTVKL